MSLYRVLVVGGYGLFGRRLVERLSRHESLHITVAGRSDAKGMELVQELRPTARAELSSGTFDALAPEFTGQLVRLAPDAVVHTSGPFQGQDYRVAKACISAGANYIDLADGREFVSGITDLDSVAAAAGLLVASGASSVPALSSAVADHLARGMSRVHDIDIGISPGNRTERGLSTVQAILSYCGKPLPGTSGASTYGWSGSRRHGYPEPVGSRLLSPCDVPDLALLPGRYLGNPTVRFGAGLELPFLHLGMNAMAGMTRMGLVADWSRYASLLKRAADWFKRFGSDAGAMHVSVTGELTEGGTATRTWQLVATEGDGPYVPTLAAAALIRKLMGGEKPPSGARPCVGMLTLEDFTKELVGLNIEMTEPAQ